MAPLLFVLLLAAGNTGPTTATQPAKKDDPDRLICKYITPTGSRIASEKVCATAAQWKDRENNAQDFFHKMDSQSGVSQGSRSPF